MTQALGHGRLSGVKYQIQLTADAEKQLHGLAKNEQQVLRSSLISRLSDRPTIPTRAIKRLLPNPLFQFELRVGDLRALYNVEAATAKVVVAVIGKKAGNVMIVDNKEYHGHQPD